MARRPRKHRRRPKSLAWLPAEWAEIEKAALHADELPTVLARKLAVRGAQRINARAEARAREAVA